MLERQQSTCTNYMEKKHKDTFFNITKNRIIHLAIIQLSEKQIQRNKYNYSLKKFLFLKMKILIYRRSLTL